MALYTGRRSLREPAKLPIWLVSTAGRTARRILRKRSSRTRTEQKAPPPTPAAEPDERIAQLQQRAVMEAALGQLDARCRELLRAMFYASEEKSYRDIARELNIPFNSLGPVRRRCLQKLRSILEDFDND
jgi:RNA polymerase sigma factor (sigma-70 family)